MRQPLQVFVLMLTGLLLANTAQAAGPLTLQRFPRLAEYLSAFDATEAAVFEELVIIREQPDAASGLEQLLETLANLSDPAAVHSFGPDGHLSMVGPLRIFETRATPGLVAMIRARHDSSAAAQALTRSELFTPEAVAVLRRGREFEAQLYEILLDDRLADKRGAVSQAVQTYLADDALSVASAAKDFKLMTEHPYANAFRAGFPQLCGVLWSTRWLQLAVLEPLVSNEDAAVKEAGVNTTMERLQDKLIQYHGMMGLPSEMPTVPVVSPLMYNRHPEAARILDNLSMLEIVLADILSHPQISERRVAMQETLDKFTDKSAFLVSERDYLLYSLRGGIYNQGGPALGGMDQSERNRSRDEQEHTGHVPMPIGIRVDM